MLEIKNITKEYLLKNESVQALKGISITFRQSEFVSILGPSGCGKTTLLNIIGGLDRYTDGDLIINNISTKQFKDKDWDNYRNHKVGFVFQNYNLIPHQTVLENVELALTLSGVKKSERKMRAIQVLKEVGLGDKLKAKPNQLSGGQMQRVAIARALVNDPDIILADEPTGALDSKTSVQIMNLLKEVSKDRLVIMVTHNPELAESYSTRIIRLLDGELTLDTNPYAPTKKIKPQKSKKSEETEKVQKKKSMSFLTAMFLSFKNLLTKKGRTLMVAFAGSIGIIGIALILAVSAGMTGYINKMQKESLSSYPVGITTVALDTNAAMSGMMSSNKTEQKENVITVYDPKDSLVKLGKFNYISTEFVDYVNNFYSNENNAQGLGDYNISYATDMRLVTTSAGEYKAVNSVVSNSVLSGSASSIFFEGLKKDYVLTSYNIKGGENAHFPKNKNEVALVVGTGTMQVSLLNSLGIDFDETKEIQYESLIGKTYKLITNNQYYNSTTMLPNYNFESTIEQNVLQSFYESNESIELKITCILEEKKNTKGAMFEEGIMFTQDLKNYYHENCVNSEVVQTVKNTYLNQNNTFVDGTQNFAIPYSLNISDLNHIGANSKLFTYLSPIQMQQTLKVEPLNVNLTDEEIIDFYLQTYGASSIPSGIYFYTNTFDAKDTVNNLIAKWNKNHDGQIMASDTSQMLSDMLGGLVDIISYVLIAFAGISLVVSSIMIGIITYTSVIERTKEIGVLRSVGASKKDVSRVFNAETTIIGLLAGAIGVGIAGLLTIIIRVLLKQLTGVGGLATLNLLPCVVLILISVMLTFIAGLIPARIASKKDPVLALRSE